MRKNKTRFSASADASQIIASLITCVFFMLTVTGDIERGVGIGDALNLGLSFVIAGGVIYGWGTQKLELKRGLEFSIPFCVFLVLAHIDGTFLPEFNPRIAYSAIVAGTLCTVLGLKCGTLLTQFFNN